MALAWSDELEDFRNQHGIEKMSFLNALVLGPISQTHAVTIADGLNAVSEAVVLTTFVQKLYSYDKLYRAVMQDWPRGSGSPNPNKVHEVSTARITLMWRQKSDDDALQKSTATKK